MYNSQIVGLLTSWLEKVRGRNYSVPGQICPYLDGRIRPIRILLEYAKSEPPDSCSIEEMYYQGTIKIPGVGDRTMNDFGKILKGIDLSEIVK